MQTTAVGKCMLLCVSPPGGDSAFRWEAVVTSEALDEDLVIWAGNEQEFREKMRPGPSFMRKPA